MNRRLPLKLVASITVLLLAQSVLALAPEQEKPRCRAQAGGKGNSYSTECGIFFGFDARLLLEQAQRAEEEAQPSDQEKPPVEASQEDKCRSKDRWDVTCGFVDPGNDFEFQAKQRDKLYRESVMNPDNGKVVEAFQYYHKWIMDMAVKLARMWDYNRVQNPELDPSVARPVSQLGITLATKAEQNDYAATFESLRENDVLFVFFTRSDCEFCHEMLPLIQRIAKNRNINVANASLDDQCMPGFSKPTSCETADTSVPVAQQLQVTVVPTLYMYLPKDNQWIRIATSFVTLDVVEARIVNFTQGIRTAMAKGLQASFEGRPSVDFTPTDIASTPTRYGLGKGVSASEKSAE